MTNEMLAYTAKIAAPIAAAAILGGGAMVLETSNRTSVLEERVNTHEKNLDSINGKLDTIIERLPPRYPTEHGNGR